MSASAPLDRHIFDEVMVPTYAPSGFIPVRGEGSRVWDQRGREYLDLAGGIAVTALGHCHPELVAALNRQAQALWHVSNVLTNEPALRCAQSLTRHTFAERVFFANSGAEANEAAFKLARRHAWLENPQRKRIIACQQGFHGRTLFTVTVGGQPRYREGFEPVPGAIDHIPFNDIPALDAALTGDVCAFVVEPVQGEGGVTPAHADFLAAARRLCSERGVLLVFDEVQSGAGRSGHLFAYQHYGVTPDILTTAKGIGCGFPVGAMLTTAHVASSLTPGTHGSTYGGNPLACAVVAQVLDIITRPETLAGVKTRSAYLFAELARLNAKHAVFKEVRGLGLLLGCELQDGYQGRAGDLVAACAEQGLMTLVAGGNVLRLAPSLVIPEADLSEAMARLDRALAGFVV